MMMEQESAGSRFEWLDELNPQQRKAVTHGSGPLLVVAGAGTGKTRTLAYRVAYLVATGVKPSRVLLLTFTRRAAEELLRRAAAVASRESAFAGDVWGGTFHAIGNRLLRVHGKSAGIEPDFTVIDRGDSEDLMQALRHEVVPDRLIKRFPQKRTCMAIYSRCTNGNDTLQAVLNRYFPWCFEWADSLKLMFGKYVVRKQEQNLLDYDDLLLYWERLVADPEMGDRIGGMFDHILVDEYQDTNRIQAAILRNMRRRIRNIMAVGDDAQSIYSFRAAEVRNMLDFPSEFPDAAMVPLEQNYRSVTPILDATNSLIAQASARYTKDLWSDRKNGQKPGLMMCDDEDLQDSWVVGKILEHHEQGIPLRKQAVLFRTGHLSDSLEVELTRRNIPYRKYGGLRFLEASHIKDLLGLLRIIENPRDQIAWHRSLQLMSGVGPSTASRAVQHVILNGNDPRSIKSFKFPAASKEHSPGFISMVVDLASNMDLTPSLQIERIRKFYDPLLPELYENSKARLGDLENLERVSLAYSSRRRFLTDLQLDPPNSTGDFAGQPALNDDFLVLSTIHSAKGCEWDVVFLIHAADGCLPSDMAAGSSEELEEELRLAYVAMTRARDFLYVSWPLRYYHRRHKSGDAFGLAQLSRFIRPSVREKFEQLSPGGSRYDDWAAPCAIESRDVRGSIREMWS